MAYLRQQPSLFVYSSDLKQFLLHRFPSSNYHTALTLSSDFKANDEPIYYYTLAQGNVGNLPVRSSHSGRETRRSQSYLSYDDVHMSQCWSGYKFIPFFSSNNLLKRNASAPRMTSPSHELDAYRLHSTIYQNCNFHCCIDGSQNLTTTFQSESDDVWQTRKSFYEEEVVIVLKDEVERVGFSIGGINSGNHVATINSVLFGIITINYNNCGVSKIFDVNCSCACHQIYKVSLPVRRKNVNKIRIDDEMRK
uniref:TLDc domain-containing protein n=1 Tax=Elaeophora elaphi TaxID=1147741 RepID=A0A0R3RV53_9BILA